jgi:type IV secretion system protein VirB9
MKRLIPALALLPSALAAQVMPLPDQANPRLQTIDWVEGREVVLTALPQTGLTVVLEPGEAIERVALGNDSAMSVQVSADRDSFLLLPKGELQDVPLLVQTDRRSYPFRVRTESGLMAAYLVRFTFAPPASAPEAASLPHATGEVWAYRLRGDQSVRPSAISDDGVRTTIEFSADQPLPAVFAIGSTGEEEVVNGYMRDDRFVIDRVHSELVFRIDKARATARRADQPEQGR